MNLDFEKMGGLIPAIIQDNYTQKVLMLGFMNEEAYQKTVETGKVTFFSRTKNRLWTKGEESGNFLNVIDIIKDPALLGGIGFTPLFIGFLGAFISGCLACKFMINLVKKGKLIYFAIYCAIVGIATIIFAL